MPTILTATQWTEIFQNSQITRPLDIAIFQAIYSFEGKKAYASQIGRKLGYTEKSPQSPVNSEIGHFAKRISKDYDINFTHRNLKKYKYWDLFFEGWNEGRYYVWKLRSEIIEALEETGLTGSSEQLPEEIPLPLQVALIEGAKRKITVNAYERDNKARQLCIEHHGTICTVCDFDFESTYGKLGKGFIHVHHLTPISKIGEEYIIDPIEDLRPVCPNCHAMLHKQDPPFTIDELKAVIIN